MKVRVEFASVMKNNAEACCMEKVCEFPRLPERDCLIYDGKTVLGYAAHVGYDVSDRRNDWTMSVWCLKNQIEIGNPDFYNDLLSIGFKEVGHE